MPHMLIKYAHVLICISVGKGSWYFSAFHYYSFFRAGGPNDTNKTLTVYFPQTPNWFYGILWSVGGIHVILSLWMVVEYFVKEKPNIIWTIPSVQKIV